MKLSCLIVDDEPMAHTILENYIQKVNSLQLVGRCYDAASATTFLHAHPVDLMLLDIRLPDMDGLDFLATLPQAPVVIIISAYSEFALDSYEHGVVDYLLKPVRFPRFMKAINKAIQQHRWLQQPLAEVRPAAQAESKGFITLQEDHTLHKIKHEDILYLQAYGNYVKLFTTERMILGRTTLKELEEALPSPAFIRVHKSFIVHLDKVARLEGNQLFIAQRPIPISTSYRQLVLKHLG